MSPSVAKRPSAIFGGNHPRVERWAGPLALAATGMVMLWWSWRKWPDILVDFGRELYVAWQLASGKRLYVDIAYFNGPLSPYINALWFRIFGTSFLTLALCNVGLLVLLVSMVYVLLARIGGRFSATIACLVFLTLFGFAQLSTIGNYNFVSPYSHEMTHGIALAVAAILLLSTYHRTGRWGYAAGAGVALGFVFLTKAELLLATALALITSLSLATWAGRRSAAPSLSRSVKPWLVVGGAAVLAPAIAFSLLCMKMPAGRALEGVLGTWPSILGGEIARLPFYSAGMGLSAPGSSIAKLLAWSSRWAAALVPVAFAAFALRQRSLRWIGFALAATAAGVLTLAAQWRTAFWYDMARPLPVAMLALAVVSLVRLVRERDDPGATPRTILRLSLIVFAGALLLKIVLFARIHHYGFVLGLPGTLLTVLALTEWMPDSITRLGGQGALFRVAALAMLTGFVAHHLAVNGRFFSQRIYQVSHGADAIMADARGREVEAVVGEIMKRVSPHESLAALPEGAMLNFLARRDNPTPYPVLMPPELFLFGEANILSSFEAHPPDYIALVHKDTTEYNYPFFGRDYGRGISSWISANYKTVFLAGAPPLMDERFGILLMQRADSH